MTRDEAISLVLRYEFGITSSNHVVHYLDHCKATDRVDMFAALGMLKLDAPKSGNLFLFNLLGEICSHQQRVAILQALRDAKIETVVTDAKT